MRGMFKSRGLVCSGDRLGPVQGFEFVKRNQADYPVVTLCRLLGVSTSGYYAWRSRPPSGRTQSDARLIERMRTLHQRSRGTYWGSPYPRRPAGGRRADQPQAGGASDALGGLGRDQSAQRVQDDRAGPRCAAGPRSGAAVFFTAERPDRLWVADITYVPTLESFLFLAVVMDAFSRRIVGWAMATHLRTELILDALNMAICQRRPRDVIHHSDQGTQYASIAFGARCKAAGIRPSMGSVGDCFDNALCESFFATLECELLERRRFKTRAEAKLAIFGYSRAGTTHIVATRPSATCHPSTTRGGYVQH